MAKILIYIFSLLAANGILPDSISKHDLRTLRHTCISLYEQKKYPEAIVSIEKYISFRDEIRFKIYLAKSFLFREDLPSPNEEDEIFLRQEKIHAIIKNYSRAAKIFSEVIPYLERVTPKDKSIADLYFLWAIAKQFSEDKETAISLYKRSAALSLELRPLANYNIAALYEDLGQIKDSDIYFKKAK